MEATAQLGAGVRARISDEECTGFDAAYGYQREFPVTHLNIFEPPLFTYLRQCMSGSVNIPSKDQV